MQADLPHTLYLRNKDKGKKGSKGKSSFKYNKNDPAIEKQEDAIRRAAERRASQSRGSGPYTMDELFR